MSNILILYISLISPFILLLFIVAKEVRNVFTFYVLGATICVICGEIDGFILNSGFLSQYEMTVNLTPVIEETLKAVPIIYYAFVFKPDHKSLIRSGISIGIGFAVLETVSALVNAGDTATIGWALIRGLGAGMVHSLCGLGMAFGLANANKLKQAFIPVIIGTFAAVILFHSSYNVLVQSPFSYFGLILTMFVYAIIIMVIALYKKNMKGESNNDTQTN